MANILWNYCLDINAEATHPKHTQIRLINDYVENCHNKGIRVHTWTVNEKEDMEYLLYKGVDAIITNYPDIAIEVRRKKGEYYAN